MENNTKWLMSLEKGQRQVAMLILAVVFLVGWIIKREIHIGDLNDKIHNYDSACSERVQNIQSEASITIQKIQAQSAIDMQQFMKEQLDKAEAANRNTGVTVENTKKLHKEILKVKNKTQTLINNEK